MYSIQSLSSTKLATYTHAQICALAYTVAYEQDIELLADVVTMMSCALPKMEREKRDAAEAAHEALRQLLHRVRQGGPWAFTLNR